MAQHDRRFFVCGDTTLVGGQGNDTLIGGIGINELTGALGDDSIVAAPDRYPRRVRDVDFTLTDISLSGLGTDVLVNLDRARLTGGEADNSFTVTGWTEAASLIAAG